MKATVEATAPGTGGSVVVVDFLRFDPRPKLAEVLRGCTDRPLFRVDPVADLVQGADLPDLRAQASAYAELIGERAGDVAALAGYCNAAALTLLIAAELHERGTRPNVILVDPQWPDPARVAAEYAALRHSLGAAAAATGPGELDEMVATLRADLTTALSDEDSPEEEIELMVAALVPRYRAWLGLLLASAAAPAPDGRPHIVAGRGIAVPPPLDTAVTRLDIEPDLLLAAGSPALGVLGDLLRAA